MMMAMAMVLLFIATLFGLMAFANFMFPKKREDILKVALYMVLVLVCEGLAVWCLVSIPI